MGYGTGWTAEAVSKDLCFYEQLDIESNFYKWLNNNAIEYRVEPFVYITYNINIVANGKKEILLKYNCIGIINIINIKITEKLKKISFLFFNL